jgi:hypothetical protein
VEKKAHGFATENLMGSFTFCSTFLGGAANLPAGWLQVGVEADQNCAARPLGRY